MRTNKFWILTKYLLMGGGYKSRSKKKSIFTANAVAAVILRIFLFVMFAGLVALIDAPFYFGLKMFHAEYLMLQMNYAVITFIIFFFGIFYTMGTFYYSNDINFLIPMPLKPETIVASKFTVSLIYEYFITAIVLVPCTLIYGIGSGMGVPFYIFSIILIIFEPILPLAVALLISIFIMPFVNRSKKKDLFKTLGGILAVAFGLSINVITNSMSSSNSKQMLSSVTKANSVMKDFFPLGNIASKALVGTDLVYLGIFILINVVSFIVIMYLGKLLYFKGVQGLSESSSTRKKIDKKKMEKEVQRKSVLFAYTMKEIKILFRTPAYFVNCVMSSFIFPIVIVVPAMVNKRQRTGISELMKYMNGTESFRILITAAIVFGLLMGAVNAVTSTAISREGSNFFVMKYLPISYAKQITAKLLCGILVGGISIVLVDIVALFAFKFPIYILLYMIIAGMLGIIFASIIGMYIDINTPKLEWDNEQRAVKSNVNSFIDFLISIIPSVIVIIMCIFVKINYNIFFILCVLVFTILDYLLYKFVCKSGEKKIASYES
ncbi:hypothetical protein CUB90_09520 [Clostridium sp. CT7]|nr:hypothetical protein CUB90_09520 [Clostridium sp. CT7]